VLVNDFGTAPSVWVTGLGSQGESGAPYGYRTNRGGMASFEKSGLLVEGDPAVESDYVEQAGSIRDVFAWLQGASSSGAVTLQVLHRRMVAGAETTIETIELTFAESEIVSTAVSGASLLPEEAGDWYALNVTAAGTGAYGLEVLIRR